MLWYMYFVTSLLLIINYMSLDTKIVECID